MDEAPSGDPARPHARTSPDPYGVGYVDGLADGMRAKQRRNVQSDAGFPLLAVAVILLALAVIKLNNDVGRERKPADG